MALLGDRDEPLLHRLEQGGLELRRRAVDLVQHHRVREQRARIEHVRPERRVVGADLDADDVGRHQVGGALDARVVAADGARDDARQRRLADAGDVLDQQVAVGEEAATSACRAGRSTSIIARRTVASSARPWSRARISARVFSSSITLTPSERGMPARRPSEG